MIKAVCPACDRVGWSIDHESDLDDLIGGLTVWERVGRGDRVKVTLYHPNGTTIQMTAVSDGVIAGQ